MLILPISGVIPLGGFAMADRYAYLAMVPLIVLAATAAVWLWKRLGQLGRLTLTTLIACQILFYAHSTHAQIVVWRNDETLWRAVWSHFPNSAMANCQLAAALADQGQFEPASVFAMRALELSPNSPEAQAIAGLIDLKLRRYDAAAKRLSEATQAKPTLVAARYNLACAYARLGRLAEAYEVLRELLVTQPEYAALAVRDGELAALRNHPDYAARFGVLVGGAKKPAI
jgi:tetratricopeptide (TPR) repeat protein